VQRTVLAAKAAGGDPHALDPGTPLHALTVSLLAAAAELPGDTPAREIWSTWNVLVDPVSSNVFVLNLPLLGDSPVAEMARRSRGTHLVLTYGQLSSARLQWPPTVACFSCENPSVLIAAEQALGASCPPLVCTGGRPSEAVRVLLSAVHRAGAPIRHHGDFDEAGVQIFRDLEDRYGAVPWRFDVASLAEELRERGLAVPKWFPATLEEAVAEATMAVPEELVIEKLISDLRAGCQPVRWSGS
jgi:uncharacterized protein (TIGR02679 family)